MSFICWCKVSENIDVSFLSHIFPHILSFIYTFPFSLLLHPSAPPPFLPPFPSTRWVHKICRHGLLNETKSVISKGDRQCQFCRTITKWHHHLVALPIRPLYSLPLALFPSRSLRQWLVYEYPQIFAIRGSKKNSDSWFDSFLFPFWRQEVMVIYSS